MLSLFPRGILDEILNLIESVSERFPSYSSDTEAPFSDLHLPILDGFVSSKIYDKRDDFDFDIVNFPF